ncbi:helix-turn-helix transcriptional regulator [Streptomyces sp. NPDC091259]|uniref:helix-turn-helix domain-containing protein n=1 Tax=Streptomyces sp. NPDC091259 TaxID=3365976 RepID=UPI0038258DD0
MTQTRATEAQPRATRRKLPALSVKARRAAAMVTAWREAAGLTLREASEGSAIDFTRLSRLEKAKYHMGEGDVLRLASAYKITDPVAVRAVAAAAETPPGSSWTASYARHLSQSFVDFIELEGDAERLRLMHPVVVPGLLQTPGYARELIGRSQEQLAERAETLVAVRLGRQEVLSRAGKGVELHALVHEAALHAHLGDGGTVMSDQVRHLLDLGSRPGIKVQVVPLSTHPAYGSNGGLTLLEFAHPWAPVASVDSATGGKHTEDPREVEVLAAGFDFTASAALPVDQSRELLKTHLERLKA